MTTNTIHILRDAADALDEVTQWMDEHALPILNKTDDSDGGNSLSAGLAVKAEEIRDHVRELESRQPGNLILRPDLAGAAQVTNGAFPYGEFASWTDHERRVHLRFRWRSDTDKAVEMIVQYTGNEHRFEAEARTARQLVAAASVE